jgi:hypothetical protein
MSIVIGDVPMLVPVAEGLDSYIDYPTTGYDHRLDISGDGVTQLVATYGSQTMIIDHIGVSLSNPIPTDTGAVAFTYEPVLNQSPLVYLDTWCRAPSSKWDASIVRPGVIEVSDIQTRSFKQLMPCAYRLTIVQGVLQTDESRGIATWTQTQDSKTVLLRALSDPSSP